MASIKLTGDTSGEITISAPAVAGTNTLTLPANTGNIVTTGDSNTVTQGMIASGVAGTGPAFSASGSSNMTISNNTWTKAALDVEDFDTDSCYDNVTNYRFTPNVAGYYQFTALTHWDKSNTASQIQSRLYKNGSPVKYLTYDTNEGTANGGDSGSVIEYANGTTDYFELYVYQTSGVNMTLYNVSELTYFQSYLVRAA